MSAKRVNVSIADEYLNRVPQVVRRMKRAGLKVEQQLDTIGVISGTVEADKLAGLGEIEGVAAVEPSQDVQIPPPHSPVQ